MSTASSATQGASQGATLGTALGSVVPGVGNAVGAGVGAAVGGLAGAASTIGQGKDKRRAKKQLAGDYAAMQDGTLGRSTEAERKQAVMAAMTNAGQQAGAAQQQIARDSLADGGARNMGAYTKAQQAVGAQAADAGSQASQQFDAMNKKTMEARRQEVIGRIDKARGVESGEQQLSYEQMTDAQQGAGETLQMMREMGILPSTSGMVAKPVGGVAPTTGA